MNYLTQIKPAGRTDYFRVVRQFVSSYAQRGLLIVISDFLDDADCEKALQYLADFGHELMLVHVWAEEDRTPPWDGELELFDAEIRRAAGHRVRRGRAREIHRGVRRVRAHAAQAGFEERGTVREPLHIDADRGRDFRTAGARGRSGVSRRAARREIECSC